MNIPRVIKVEMIFVLPLLKILKESVDHRETYILYGISGERYFTVNSDLYQLNLGPES